ncbi:hypothetical protein X962_5220 [Burkholderia pseudomallei MSHR7343]|nr:hypothetical protein X962_5220 [Burkholderia pseudomallei MSHR7343]
MSIWPPFPDCPIFVWQKSAERGIEFACARRSFPIRRTVPREDAAWPPYMIAAPAPPSCAGPAGSSRSVLPARRSAVGRRVRRVRRGVRRVTAIAHRQNRRVSISSNTAN